MKRALEGVIGALGQFSGDPIDLLVGEPCFQPPAEIVEAFGRVAREPVSGYGPPAGLERLREILAAWDGSPRTRAAHVVVTHGAKGALLALFTALVEPGDEVIHPLPCYPAYPAMVRRFGGIPIGVAETGEGFSGWIAAVTAAMGPRTRAVVLSSPSNPSGAMISADALAALIEICRDRGVRVILDEAYVSFRFDGLSSSPGPGLPGDTLVRVGSASKGLALCGWRMGWVITDRELVTRVAQAQAALLNPPATPPQRAMLALPSVPAEYFEKNRREVHQRLEVLAAAVGRAGFEVAMPDGGFYLWVDIRERLHPSKPDSATWCEALALERGVGFWPGEDYGAPGWVRLALPQGDHWRDDIDELERRLSADS